MKKFKLPNEALEALDSLDNLKQENNKIEEHLFIKKYLPLFLVNDAPRLFAWSNVAGSPYRPVDIMRNGVKVAEVPPLLLELPVRDSTGRNSMFEQVSTIAAEAARIPSRGPEYISKRLIGLMPEPEADRELMKKWIALINLYTEGSVEDKKEEKGNVEEEFTNNLDEDLGFEEF